MLLQLQRDGDDPPALRRRVKLKKGLAKYRDMFKDLSAQREFNPAGIQSIPISEIRDYLEIVMDERCREQKRFAMKLILEMDSVFMEYVRKKQKERSPSP